MEESLKLIAKTIAPVLIKILKQAAEKTENKVDDGLVDTLEFILKRMKLI